MSPLESHVAGRVRSATGELSGHGATLVALGNALQEFAALPGGASADEVKHAAVSVAAVASKALASATDALLVAERLDALAGVLEVDAD